MADINVPAGAIGTPLITLTAGVPQTVRFADDLETVEVVSDAGSVIWWTCDGSTPSPGNGWYIPAVGGVDERRTTHAATDGRPAGTTVILVSAGSTTARVQRS